jgi:SAM-dependent methyltransferase
MSTQGQEVIAQQEVVHARTTCRLCGSRQLKPVWSFGETPLANAYVTPEDVASGAPEHTAPLTVQYCADCHLVQLRDVVDPEVLFGNYLYVSSTSPSFVAHFEGYAKTLIERYLDPLLISPSHEGEKLVVDVGSNDGILLKPLQAAGIRVLGVDPAENVAALANAAGIPTVAAFFTPETARQIKAAHGPAQVISANNVFAHTDDVALFVEAVKELLAPEGIFVFEVQYLKDLVEKNLFDIVYHEHLCYYHVAPLMAFFQQQGLTVFDVERVPVHGGSIRVFVGRAGVHPATEHVTMLLQEEVVAGLNTPTPYEQFAQRIEHNKQSLQQLLQQLKSEGKRIVGYGAPAKATTLCYAFGLDGSLLDYIVEDAPLKQGRLMPGTHIPIVSPEHLYTDKPQYCLILAWNFAEQIMHNHARFPEQGGKFILPVPEPRIV